MRILELLASPAWTGPAEPMASISRELIRRGHSVQIAVDTIRSGDIRDRLLALQLPVRSELALSTRSGPIRFGKDWRRLRGMAEEFDLLHSNFSHDHILALLAARGSPTRVVRTIHSSRSLERRGLQNWILRRTHGLIAVCDAHARILRERFQVDPRRIASIPGAVDSRLFAAEGPDLRAELRIPKDAPVAGIVSRIKPERRHLELIASFRDVWLELPRARLVIFGRGEALPEVKAAVAKAGLEQGVIFGGYRTGPQLAAAYRTLDVKVLLAEGNDGTCRAVLEAMACGRPAIAYRFGAPAEVIIDGATGILVPEGDKARLSDALRGFLSARELGQRLGAAARRRAEAFTEEARGRAVERFLEQVLQLGGPSLF